MWFWCGSSFPSSSSSAGAGSGSVAVFIGAFILAAFLAFFNYLTPSGQFVIASRVVEVMPNVTGEVVAIPVKPNVLVKAGTVLFEIDPTPYRYKVNQLEASLAQADQQAKQLKATYAQATANVEGLTAQLAYNTKRLADIQKLEQSDVNTVFKEQDTQVQFETVSYQLQAAKAAQQNAKLAMDSEIGGVNTTVAQIQAQLNDAKWQLEQTTIRAPANGTVTTRALAVGDRALQARAVMSFILDDDITIGMFSANGFQTIKPGAPVKLVFDNEPGRIYHAQITEIPRGVGQGQIAVSGDAGACWSDRRCEGLSGDHFPAGRHGSGAAAPRHARNRDGFADNAGVIGLLMSILVWVSSYTAYL
jgi:multidrug resistance efflux pump